MSNIIKRVWHKNKMVSIESLHGMAFQSEDGGHTFEISGVDDSGATVAFSGTVSGVFMRADRADVALTGAVSDGVASVTLSDACYAVPGRFGLTVFVTEGGKTTAIYAAVGTVARTSNGVVAGDTPQNVVDLITAIENAVASIPANYSDLSTSVQNLAEEVRITTGNLDYTYETGEMIRHATGEMSISSASNATGFVDISNFNRIKYKRVKTTASSVSAGMAFYDSTKTYISGLTSAVNQDADGYFDYEIDVPANAKYARFTFWQDTTIGTFSVSGWQLTKKYIENLVSDFDELSKKISPVSYPFSYREGMYVRYQTGVAYSSSNFSLTDFIPLNGAEKILYSRIKATSSDPMHGMAFYSSDNVDDYISGIVSSGGNSAMGSDIYEADVPDGATHARFSWFSSGLRETYGEFELYDKDEYEAALEGRTANLESRVQDLENAVSQDSSRRALISDAIQSEGVQAAVLRARQFSDIMWTPVADMPGIKKNLITGVYDYVPFKKGVRQKGIPYSRVDDDKRIANAVSFDCFATAVLNPNSILYTSNIYSAANKRATSYGVVCSKMVQYAWGCPEIYASQEIEHLPGLTKIAIPGQWDENDIKVGDGVINPQVHCTICTDVLRDVYGIVRAIEITEAVTPQCVRRTWTIPEFFKYFATYGLYRYQYIDDAVYEKSPYIDLEDGLTGEKDIPIAIRRGSYCVVPLNSTRAADVDNTRWTTMHVLHNGTETTTAINASTINMPTSEHGYYEVWPTDALSNRGNSSFYYVQDAPTISHLVDGTTLVLTYSADCPADHVVWTGGYTHFTFLDGSGSEEVTIPTGATAFKIAFKSKYGVWWSSSISLE